MQVKKEKREKGRDADAKKIHYQGKWCGGADERGTRGQKRVKENATGFFAEG